MILDKLLSFLLEELLKWDAKQKEKSSGKYCRSCYEPLPVNTKHCPNCNKPINKELSYTTTPIKSENDNELCRFANTAAKSAPMPKELISYLPNNKMFEILGHGMPSNYYGEKLHIGPNGFYANGEFIQYRFDFSNYGGYPDENCYNLFAESLHPFISKYTSNWTDCAKTMISSYFTSSPKYYEISINSLRVSFASGYHNSGYAETDRYIRYENSYEESYHDGGGSGFTEWYLYKANKQIGEVELSQEKQIEDVILPNCKGHIFENDHLYLIDPWNIPGVFEFYYYESIRSSYNSDEGFVQLGIKQ